MKKNKVLGTILFTFLASLTVSCVSLQDRVSQGNEVLETIQITFTSYQPLQFIISKEKIKEKAYLKLMEEAEKKYQGEIDIVNINIKGSFSAWNLLLMPAGFFAGGALGAGLGLLDPEGPASSTYWVLSISGMAIGPFAIGNAQKVTATGEIIATGEYRALSQSTRNRSNTRMTPLQRAINKASDAITLDIPNRSKIAVLNIESSDKNLSEQVIDELEYIFVTSRNFTIVDRRTIDTIMQEQHFQLSGNVADNEAVSIGKMSGANIVITGSISGTGSSRRLTLRVLDVQTGQIITMARETF